MEDFEIIEILNSQNSLKQNPKVFFKQIQIFNFYNFELNSTWRAAGETRTPSWDGSLGSYALEASQLPLNLQHIIILNPQHFTHDP